MSKSYKFSKNKDLIPLVKRNHFYKHKGLGADKAYGVDENGNPLNPLKNSIWKVKYVASYWHEEGKGYWATDVVMECVKPDLFSAKFPDSLRNNFAWGLCDFDTFYSKTTKPKGL